MSDKSTMADRESAATSKKPAPEDERWEREMIHKLVFEAVREQRRARRWGIVIKLLFLAYLAVALYLIVPSEVSLGPHTALVEIEGVIAQEEHASADNVVSALRSAFENRNSRGVIVRANSPGGSPVQADYVYGEIQRLREKYPDKPLYAVVTDVCASACYYIVSAADRVYANKASVVGSIGVLYNGFGFTGLLEKAGVERRLLTAGENKGMMDPFSPLREDEVDHIKQMLDEIHQQFINAVRQGRGKRLDPDEPLFEGLFWSGERALELGLVDEFGSAGYVAREVIGEDDLVDYTPQEDLLQRLSEQMGAVMMRIFQQGPVLR